MTLANKITLCRIFLIPVFVGCALYYTAGLAAGQPLEWLRHVTVAVFAVASLSDALDGWIARRFNQRTRLGAILDPLADKLLVTAAAATLTFGGWPVQLPLWFVIILFAREVFSTMGAFVIQYMAGKVKIEPHWTGKVSTFFAMVTLAQALLCIRPGLVWMALLASLFACISGAVYTIEAVRQINAADGEGSSGSKAG